MEQTKLPNLDGLLELGNRDGLDIRPTLLRVTTDLYVAKPAHSAEEERQYTELALRLIDLVDRPTRAAVAKRLMAYPAAPEPVLRRVACETLTDQTPAQDIGEAASAAAAPEAAHQCLADAAVAADELNELFFTATAAERRLILLNLNYAPFAPAEPIDRKAVGESIRRLEAAALTRNTEGFAQEIERTLGISRERARRITADASGECIVVAGIALGMPTSVLQRILLCLNPVIGQSVQRVYDLDLLREEIEPPAALRLLAIWRGGHKADQRKAARAVIGTPAAAQPPSAESHQPYHWHVETAVRGASSQSAASTQRPKINWEQHAQHKVDGA